MTEATKKSGRVLCVDDEPHILRALQWLLKKEFEVITATSAGEGIRLLQRNDFDVVISDQRMPGVTGVEFLREVRKSSPRSVRILLTGYAELDAMVRSVNESEVFRFITKPWDVKALPDLIAEAVSIANIDTLVVADETPIENLDFTASSGGPAQVSAGPALAPGSAATNEPAAIAASVGSKVLVLDDDPVVHQAIDDVFGNSELALHSYSLAEAIKYLNEHQIGVIVSDFKVGKMDATRLIRMMKGEHPEIISVVFSAVQDAEYVVKLINEGQVYRFIPKPFKPSFIKLIVCSALKRHVQLVQNPQLLSRFKVDAVSSGTAESLLLDVEKSAAQASPRTVPPDSVAAPMRIVQAAAQASSVPAIPRLAVAANSTDDGQALTERLKSGFRKLFKLA